MRWTRRAFVGGAVPALVAAGVVPACRGRSAEEPHHPVAPASAGGAGLLLTFEGLCGFVADAAQNPKAIDVALVSFSDTQVNGGKGPRHCPTLQVGRPGFLATHGEEQSARPDAVDLHHAYYSLDDCEVAVVSLDAAPPALRVNAGPLPADPKKCPAGSSIDSWNNLSWLLDVAEYRPGARLRTDWGSDRQNLRGLVRLRNGVVEDENIENLPQELKGVRLWKTANGARLLKESVRVLWPAAGTYKIEIGNRTTGLKRTVFLDGGSRRQKPHIYNVPAVEIADDADGFPFSDVMAFDALLEGGSTGVVPTVDIKGHQQKDRCDVGATPDCGCCPGMRLVAV